MSAHNHSARRSRAQLRLLLPRYGSPLYIVHTNHRESIQKYSRQGEGVKIYARKPAIIFNAFAMSGRSSAAAAMKTHWIICGRRSGMATSTVLVRSCRLGMPREADGKGNVWETSSGFPSEWNPICR